MTAAGVFLVACFVLAAVGLAVLTDRLMGVIQGDDLDAPYDQPSHVRVIPRPFDWAEEEGL